MACSKEYRAELDGKPTDDPAQPSEVRGCDRALQVFKIHHHQLGALVASSPAKHEEFTGSGQKVYLRGIWEPRPLSTYSAERIQQKARRKCERDMQLHTWRDGLR